MSAQFDANGLLELDAHHSATRLGSGLIEVLEDAELCLFYLPSDFPAEHIASVLRAYQSGERAGRESGRLRAQHDIKQAIGILT